ncbi:MAG: hypothetical protein ACD_26C00022G0001 [uncultured bacterium]|nr:MAG: hypothetical protein ACD_26C00022G0001 [uncultured bacterium]
MNVIILYGLPAVGKLTIAKELSNITGYKLFHNHLSIDFALAFFKFGTPKFVKTRNELWLKGLKIAKDCGFTGLILTIAFEKTLDPKLILNINKYFNVNDKIYYIHLKCGKEELIKRVSNKKRNNTGKINSPEQLFHLMNTRFVYTPYFYGKKTHEIDITYLKPTKTVKLIVRFINKNQ